MSDKICEICVTSVFLFFKLYFKISQLAEVLVVGGNALSGGPCRERLDRLSLLDREAEAGCRRKSHDGACTVRGKVTLIIHEQPCKLVSILKNKSSGAVADCCQ